MIPCLAVVLFLTGCQKRDEAEATKSATVSNAVAAAPINGTNQSAQTNTLRSFTTRGLIRDLSTNGRTLLVRHEEIPGYMPKMTMEFDVRDTNELRGLKIGDAITFFVKATDDDSWIEGLRLSTTNDLAPLPPPGPSAASLLNVAQLKPGDVLPDAELLSENGSTFKLASFQGRAFAFTFIFSRCPIPNFCPRMNQHFGQAREMLLQRSGGPTNWQFLSLSFDPDFDKPDVLSRYAYSYRGKNTNRWLFASAPTNVVAAMSSLLDFRFANEGGSFLHNLRTVVVDPKRRVYKQFDGNSWKAEELAEAIVGAAQSIH